MRRLIVFLTVLALAAPAPVALAQSGSQGGGGSAFTPLPQPGPAETPTPTPPPTQAAQQDTDRKLLFAIGAGLIVLFVVIARTITRDARRNLPEHARAADGRRRDEGPHRHGREAKAKARAKTKAQRAARRQNR